MPTAETIRRDTLIARIMDQSYRVSMFAPAMKPFIRFAPGDDSPEIARLYWDFDDLLQKRLLDWAYELASPARIADEGILRWKTNLRSLYEKEALNFEEAKRNGVRARAKVRIENVKQIQAYPKAGGRLLFIGAGTGPMCLQLADYGFQVIGIDPLVNLLTIGQAWAGYLDLPATFVGMDARDLGFKPHSFDSIHLGIYGFLPAWSQNQALQWQMARVLKPDGIGIVAGIRKKYASHWYRLGHLFPPALAEWLRPQTALDFHSTSPDGCEERLRYGLYHRSHSVESLRQELGYAFEVLDCFYDSDDERYLTAIVRPKPEAELSRPAFDPAPFTEPEVTPARLYELDELLVHVETLTDELEAHTRRAMTCFTQKPALSPGACFRQLAPQIAPFVRALQELFIPVED